MKPSRAAVTSTRRGGNDRRQTLHDDVPEGSETEVRVTPVRLQLQGSRHEVVESLRQITSYGR